MTTRAERETLVRFSDADLLNGGDATIYTFREATKRKCLRAGGRVVREHIRKGKVEAWDLAIPANLVRIGFKSRAKAEAALRSDNLKSRLENAPSGTKTCLSDKATDPPGGGSSTRRRNAVGTSAVPAIFSRRRVMP
jgi:hypothetical protein